MVTIWPKKEFDLEGGGGRQAGERVDESSEVYKLDSRVLYNPGSTSARSIGLAGRRFIGNITQVLMRRLLPVSGGRYGWINSDSQGEVEHKRTSSVYTSWDHPD